MSESLAAERLELFFGEAHEGEARIYARLSNSEPAKQWKISGQLIGPECRFSHTLRATIAFQPLSRGGFTTEDRLPGESPLVEAILPDPCFWTPEVPLLYQARIELQPAEQDCKDVDTITVERWLGIRRLGTRGKSFFLDGERWVPRGASCLQASSADLPAARKANVLLCVPLADDAFCLEASQSGVPLAVDLRGSGIELEKEISRLARWPAVFFVVIDARQRFESDPRHLARNLLFAVSTRSGEPANMPPWAHAIWCEIGANEPLPVAVGSSQLPVIVVRRRASSGDLAAGRIACDRLQYDLAPTGDFAGYVV